MPIRSKSKYFTKLSSALQKNSKGHIWQRDFSNDIDFHAFQMEDYHNGPICINCGYGFCHHCDKVPSISCKGRKE